MSRQRRVRDEAAADPVLLREHLVLKVVPDAEQRPDATIAIDRLEVLLVRQEIVVQEPFLAPIDGDEIAGALGVVAA